MSKYIFVTGGIVSGIGKGITVASLGTLLKARGIRVALLKIDPYVNVDAGTMNPFQHGEVFVTEDGAETDLDLGHYERFLDQNQSRDNNLTTGKIFQRVIEKERRGDYLGEDVQLIPHVTDEVIGLIKQLGSDRGAEVVITEIGGTVGDIESEVFLEAARQMRHVVGRDRVLYIHVTKIDYIYPSGEEKTKPTQHSVQAIRQRGIQPDVLVVRCHNQISDAVRKKISIFTDVAQEAIIAAPNNNIYQIPLTLEHAGFGTAVAKFLGIERKPNLKDWEAISHTVANPKTTVKIGMVGKYLDNPDAYLSVVEALDHGGIANGVKVEVIPIDSEKIENGKLDALLNEVDGILVPGGFGSRGIEGKIKAIKYAREHKKPFLGLCLGLQCATIEYARSMCNCSSANSTEFNKKTSHPVIDILPEQKKVTKKGATMRLGSYEALLKKGTLVHKLYGKNRIHERHRHRYEINPDYHRILEKTGFVISGTSPDRRLGEFIELPQNVHPFFVGTQAHPEFKSRPNRAHPLFAGFIAAALKKSI